MNDSIFDVIRNHQAKWLGIAQVDAEAIQRVVDELTDEKICELLDGAVVGFVLSILLIKIVLTTHRIASLV